MKYDAIMLSERDNVATALRDLEPRETVFVVCGSRSFVHPVREFIPYGHKFAVGDIARGADIVKYGEVIGRAVMPIAAGRHVHVENVESLRGRGDLPAAPEGAGHGV